METMMLRSLLLVTLAMGLVLLLRRPLRLGVGPGPAFALWLLVPIMAVLPWLPTFSTPWALLPTIQVFPEQAVATMTSAPTGMIHSWLWAVWLTGVALAVLRLAAHYVSLRRHSRPLPDLMAAALRQELPHFDLGRVRLHPDGPALLWALRSTLLLPPDFMQRFNRRQRSLILRHELAHLRRGDVFWNLLAELAATLLWFHPLMWLALSRFRLDQELACDECVLRHAPQDEAPYAHILMHSVGNSPVPALVPWLAEPQLKERLTMIQRHRPGALRRRIGYLALAALMVGSAVVAQAATEPASNQPATTDMAFNGTRQANYPAAAITNGEEGTVVLSVLVHADGSVGSISYDPQYSSTTSADLIAAATNAARQWRFKPQTKDGQAVDAYARVPVKFEIKQSKQPAG